MSKEISATERTYLRELARKQAGYAALPIMQERKHVWHDLNEGRVGVRPPVVVETWTFDRDFMPPSIFKCTSPAACGVEWQLLRNIRNHELIDDDKVIPDTFEFGWQVEIDELGVKISHESVKDAEGVNTGYKFHHPIKDLERDLALLKPAQCRVDREGTRAGQEFLEELLGDLLKVELRAGSYGCAMLTHRVVELMGMDAYFTAMYDCPEALHQLMAYLRDNCLRMMHWAESEGLLRLNNENQQSFGSSYNFTRELPAPGFDGKNVRLRDLWGSANSQETVGVSPAMFNEFCFPYYRDVCEPLGLLYYGCCEPVDTFWADIRRLPHLKKVSISKWCNQRQVADSLRGTDIVFSRKPDPNFLSVDVRLNDEAWAAHVRETLEATRGVLTEFIYRDVYTVHGNLMNPRRAVEIARREINKVFGS
jgi:hypothetical protein